MERLHITSKLVFIALLQYRIPIPSSCIPYYRSILLSGIHQVIQTGDETTLMLLMEIANSIPWKTLDLSPSETIQFSSSVRKLLSETGPKEPTPTQSHLNNILTLWMALSKR